MSIIVKKYLGIDWGEKRIGLALGNSENKIATPFKIVGNISEILSIIKEEEINEIVIGEPQAMVDSGLRNKEQYFSFVEKLRKSCSLPIRAVDERMSSRAADALPGDKKTKAGRDALAAMLILQSFLDRN